MGCADPEIRDPLVVEFVAGPWDPFWVLFRSVVPCAGRVQWDQRYIASVTPGVHFHPHMGCQVTGSGYTSNPSGHLPVGTQARRFPPPGGSRDRIGRNPL